MEKKKVNNYSQSKLNKKQFTRFESVQRGIRIGMKQSKDDTYGLLPGAIVLGVTREAIDKETRVGAVLHGLLQEGDSNEARNDLTILNHGRD